MMDMLETSYPETDSPPQTTCTTTANAAYDGCWAVLEPFWEIVVDDRLAANPINRLDPTGLTMTIVGQTTAKGKQFSELVLQALNAMVPDLILSFESVTTWPPGKAPGSPGVAPTISSRIVARGGSHVTQEIFCEDVKQRPAGYRLIHDLLTGEQLVTIDMTKAESGDENDLSVLINRDTGHIIATDKNRIHWNPYYAGGNARSNTDPASDYWNTISVLAHEIQHAYDNIVGMNVNPQELPANLKAPNEWPFDPRRWATEMNAIAIQNQIFQELTGIVGTRNMYGAFNVPPKWPAPKSASPCDCDKAWNELPWGAKQ
jgi:hypothetical protein